MIQQSRKTAFHKSLITADASQQQVRENDLVPVGIFHTVLQQPKDYDMEYSTLHPVHQLNCVSF